VKSSLAKKATLSTIAVVVFMVLISSCGGDKNSPGFEFMPNMYRSPSYETYLTMDNGVNADSMSALMPVEGTIARGFIPWGYGASNDEYKRAGEEAENPIAYSADIMAEGKDLYEKFCLHCHGKKGEGDGDVVVKGNFPLSVSYTSGNSSRGGKMTDMKAGHIYHTITYGLNLMGSHASQILPNDRWKIVYYVQKLQGNDPGAPAGVAGEDGATGEAESAPTDTTAVVDAPVEENETNN